MSDAFETADETHSIEGTDDLLMSVIVDQASDLEHGWREALQNGIDSPGSSRVELTFDTEHSVIEDDGDGVDLTTERGINLLTNLGESSKRDDEDTIGEFGIGKGQIIAKGVTTMKSGDTALIFDVKNHGLEVAQKTLDEPVDGLRVEVDHYDDEVPRDGSYRWDRYEDRIKARFRYVSVASDVEVIVNDDIVSRGDVREETEDYVHSVYEEYKADYGGTAYIGVGHSAEDDLVVYSSGVKVKEVDSFGLGGVVVTDRNLSLNFARNDIKSGCSLWNEVRARLDEIRLELFSDIPGDRLTDNARKFVVDTMFNRHAEGDGSVLQLFEDRNVLKTSDMKYTSLSAIGRKDKIGFANTGDPAAKKLSSAYGMTILAADDPATARFKEEMASLVEEIGEPEEFDPRQKAEEHGMFTANDYIPDDELSANRRKRLGVARHIADRMGVEREIYYGESDLADAWTDGHSEIVVTDSCMPSSNRLAWMPELFEAIVHQYAHEKPTYDGCTDHGRFFDERYRTFMSEMWPEFSAFMADAARTSVKEIAGY